MTKMRKFNIDATLYPICTVHIHILPVVPLVSFIAHCFLTWDPFQGHAGHVIARCLHFPLIRNHFSAFISHDCDMFRVQPRYFANCLPTEMYLLAGFMLRFCQKLHRCSVGSISYRVRLSSSGDVGSNAPTC